MPLFKNDKNDYVFMERAFQKSPFIHEVIWLKQAELLPYLQSKKDFPPMSGQPALVLFDTTLSEDEMQTVQLLRDHPIIQKTPLIVLTENKERIPACYKMGVQSCIQKPSSENLFDTVDIINSYWFQLAFK